MCSSKLEKHQNTANDAITKHLFWLGSPFPFQIRNLFRLSNLPYSRIIQIIPICKFYVFNKLMIARNTSVVNHILP